MSYGVFVESRIQATNIDALNRTAQAEVDVAGGGFTDPTTTTDETLSVTPEEDIEEISEDILSHVERLLAR